MVRAAVILALAIFIFAGNNAALPTGTYEGQSPFRRFVSFYFSYTSKSALGSSTVKTTEPKRNDFDYHYEKNKESLESSQAVLNRTCAWNLKQNKYAKECDMYNTNLFCHPASRTCACFSWKSMKYHDVTREIFYEEDHEIENYLLNLGDFLAIEMKWNKDINKCQSLKGSACSVPDNLSDQFLDTYYVSCYPGLSCVEVQDEGFVIGRCMQLEKESTHVAEEVLERPENMWLGDESKDKSENRLEETSVKSESISAEV